MNGFQVVKKSNPYGDTRLEVPIINTRNIPAHIVVETLLSGFSIGFKPRKSRRGSVTIVTESSPVALLRQAWAGTLVKVIDSHTVAIGDETTYKNLLKEGGIRSGSVAVQVSLGDTRPRDGRSRCKKPASKECGL